MTDREQILASLRKQERAVTHPPAWETRRHFDDLAERFTASLTAGAGEVHRAASLAEALDILGQLLAELPARQVAVNAEPPLDGIDLAARWPDIEWLVTGPSSTDLRAFCAAADAGITGVDAALAETGTIVVSSGPGKSRLVSLLPPVHIALVPTSLPDRRSFHLDRGARRRDARVGHPDQRPQQDGRYRASDGDRRAWTEAVDRDPLRLT